MPLRSVISVAIVFAVGFSTANARSQSPELYRSDSLGFSIAVPLGWKMDESSSNARSSVRFISPDGTLSVVVKTPTEPERYILGIVQQRDFTEPQSRELAKLLYGTTPGVLDPRVTVTRLASERALLSVYDLRIETLGQAKYIAVMKVETIRADRLYRVEATGPAADSAKEAGAAMSTVLGLLQYHIRTFVFLPR